MWVSGHQISCGQWDCLLTVACGMEGNYFGWSDTQPRSFLIVWDTPRACQRTSNYLCKILSRRPKWFDFVQNLYLHFSRMYVDNERNIETSLFWLPFLLSYFGDIEFGRIKYRSENLIIAIMELRWIYINSILISSKS